MRFLATILTIGLAGLLCAAPAWTAEEDFHPAVATLADGSAGHPEGELLLARGGHGHDRFLHGGHHGHDRFIHGGHRHPHHFKSHPHRQQFHRFDGHFGHFGKPRHFHPGFGISFCVRDVGVLVCFNDHAFGHRQRW